ncbi:MAG: hypothetical protein ABL900_18380 [Burkholderiaceae bacterium]
MKTNNLQFNRRVALAVLGAAVAFAHTARAADAPKQVDLVVAGGKLVSGPNLVKLERNDSVVLTIVSDRADELHVHGYNLHAHLQAGRPVTLNFTAKRTGRFSFELHKSGLELGVFEIYPKVAK